MGIDLPPGKRISEFAKQFMKLDELSEGQEIEEF